MKNPVFYSTSHFKVVVFHLHLWDFFCFLVRFKRTFDFILYVNSSKIVFFFFRELDYVSCKSFKPSNPGLLKSCDYVDYFVIWVLGFKVFGQ
jgi:hypothetical protein